MSAGLDPLFRKVAEEGSFENPEICRRLLEIRANLVAKQFDFFHLPTLREAVKEHFDEYYRGELNRIDSASVPAEKFSFQTRGLFGFASSNIEEVRSRRMDFIESHFWGFTRNKEWVEICFVEYASFFGDFGLRKIPQSASLTETTLKQICAWTPKMTTEIWQAFTELTISWYERAKEREERALSVYIQRELEDAVVSFSSRKENRH